MQKTKQNIRTKEYDGGFQELWGGGIGGMLIKRYKLQL